MATEASKWVKHNSNTNPIVLSASEVWEANCIVEPSVLPPVTVGGTFKMWYRGGGSGAGDKGKVGYATSSDGISWTKYVGNPVFTNGASHALCPTVYFEGSTYYMIFSDFLGTGKLYCVTSSDGITWGSPVEILAPSGSQASLANTFLYKEGSTYYLFVEYFHSTDNVWYVGIATSTSPTSTFTMVSGFIGAMQVVAGGSFSGSCVKKIANRYHMWYHYASAAGNLPTKIAHCISTNLLDWARPYTTPVLDITETNFIANDQVADPDVHEYNGKTYMWYDADDNASYSPAVRGAIALATFDGTLSQVCDDDFGQSLALVNGISGGSGASGITTTAIDTTGADLIVIWTAWLGAPPTITDSKGNTWIALTQRNGTSLFSGRFYYCVAPTVGSGHTFSALNTNTFSSISVMAFNGVHRTNPYITDVGANGTGTTIQPGSITPTGRNMLLVAASAHQPSGFPSINSGFIVNDAGVTYSSGNHPGIRLAYQTQVAATARNPTWTRSGTGDGVAAMVCFRSFGTPNAAYYRG